MDIVMARFPESTSETLARLPNEGHKIAVG